MKLYSEHKHNKQKGKLSKMKTTKREFDEIVDSGNDLDLGGQQKPGITPTQP